MTDQTDQAPEPQPDEDEPTRDAPQEESSHVPRVHSEDPAEGPRAD